MRKYRRTYRKPKRSPRRRTYRRLRYRPRFTRHLPMVLPDRYSCKLRYVDQVTINCAEQLVTVYDFRANDLYDPNCTGVGHQPMGFDTLTVNWDHFTVIGSKITVRPVFDSAAGNVTPAYWGVALVDAIGAYDNSAVSTLFENERVGAPREFGILNQVINRNQKTRKFSLRKFFNIPSSGVADDRFQCDSGNSPAECAYFELFCASVNGNDPGAITFIVTIEYIVVCHEPKKGDDSLIATQKRQEWVAKKMKTIDSAPAQDPSVDRARTKKITTKPRIN